MVMHNAKALYTRLSQREAHFYPKRGIPGLWRRDDWLQAVVLAEASI